jgi:hypothetical protein
MSMTSVSRKLGLLVSAAMFAVGFAACGGAEEDADRSDEAGDPSSAESEEVGEPNAEGATGDIRPGEFFSGCFPFDSCDAQIPDGANCRCDNSFDGFCDDPPRSSALFCFP